MDRALPLTRRALLAAGGAGAVAIAAGGLVRSPSGMAARPLLPGTTGTRSMFVPLVGSEFVVRPENGRSVRTRLVQIANLTHAPRDDEDAFELLLHGSGSSRMEQTMARLEHPRLRTLPLLVTPAGTGARGQDYAVVINRHHPPQL